MVVPIISSFKNQNIFASVMSDTARNALGWVSASDKITVRVPSIGDNITGAARVDVIASKSQPGINGGGARRVMPARANMSKYSESQNSKISKWVVLGSRLHARRPVLLSTGTAR